MKLSLFLLLHTAVAFAPSQRPRAGAASRAALAAYGGDGGVDVAAGRGSALWGVNLYFGFDWLLAPLGLDNDFNPATRTTVALGRVLAGRGGCRPPPRRSDDTDGGRAARARHAHRRGSNSRTPSTSAPRAATAPRPDWLAERELGGAVGAAAARCGSPSARLAI